MLPLRVIRNNSRWLSCYEVDPRKSPFRHPLSDQSTLAMNLTASLALAAWSATRTRTESRRRVLLLRASGFPRVFVFGAPVMKYCRRLFCREPCPLPAAVKDLLRAQT